MLSERECTFHRNLRSSEDKALSDAAKWNSEINVSIEDNTNWILVLLFEEQYSCSEILILCSYVFRYLIAYENYIFIFCNFFNHFPKK